MKRRTLDILFSTGGVLLAGLLLIVGIVLTSNANFARDYVKDQLSQQQITFTPASELTAEEKAANPCVTENAGKPLTTGKQAECYANYVIGTHLKSIGGGKTYAGMGDTQTELKTKLADAQAKNDPTTADLQKQLDQVNSQRDTLFKGESLRGMLLTSYGFSELGSKAGQASVVVYIGAGVLFLLALAGFGHAFITPNTKGFAVPESDSKSAKTTV